MAIFRTCWFPSDEVPAVSSAGGTKRRKASPSLIDKWLNGQLDLPTSVQDQPGEGGPMLAGRMIKTVAGR